MLLHHGTPTHTVRVYQTLHMYVSMHTVHPSLLTTWNPPVSTLGSCNSQKEISSAIQILSLTHSLSRVSLGNWSQHKSLPCSLCCSCKEEPYNKSSACCYFCCCITERFYTNTSTHTWHESPNRGWSDMSPNSTAPGACPETARDSKREKGGGRRRRISKTDEFHDATWESHISTSICLSLLLSWIFCIKKSCKKKSKTIWSSQHLKTICI